MTNLAHRMDHLAPHFFAALNGRVAEMQARGLDIIRLDEGSPDLPPAPPIISALQRAAGADNRHGYQPHHGPQLLRQAWAEMYLRVYGVDLDPETEVLPLLGSKEGIFHLSMALVEPGSAVLIPDPGYITYTRGALFAGGEPFYLALRAENSYLPNLEAVPTPVARRARLLWLNYPNNPTAATASLEFFAGAVEFARRFHLLVCHDAAYTQVTFNGGPAPSLLAVPGSKEVAVEFNTLSKSHNMAGWRVGAAIGNRAALQALFTLKTNQDSSHFLPVLEAAAAAMTGDQSWLVERNCEYRRRRDLVVGGLRRIGLAAPEPQASLYVWCPVPAGWTSVDFTSALLEGAQVSLTPGVVFGPGGEGFLRLSLTAPQARLQEALDRLSGLVPRLIERRS